METPAIKKRRGISPIWILPFIALLIGGSLSRLMIVLALAYLPPARQDGLAATTGKPPHKSIVIAALLPVLLIFLFLPWGVGLIIIALALAALLFMAWLSQRQIGGVTGDVLGAIQQTSEIAILLGLLSCGRMLA